MDYHTHYNKLIKRARERNDVLEYSESHHIIPRCMGGTDNTSNLVELTAREHLIAHLLLAKMHPQQGGIQRAAFLMCKTTSRLYSNLRECVSNQMKTNNPNAGGKARLAYIEKHGQPARPNWVISEAGRERLRNKMVGLKNPNADGSQRRKKVLLLNERKEVVHRFDSLKAAETAISANHASVFNNRARGSMYRGYYWVFEAEMH